MSNKSHRRPKSDGMNYAVDGAPVIILVRPQLGENIGASARALLNCGLSEMRIVAPRDGWPNVKALNAASGADGIISEAGIFETLEDAVSDLNLVYATTARSREISKPVFDPHAVSIDIIKNRTLRSGILFGPERNGLSNEDISLVDSIIEIPLNPAFSSLNLGQAVLIVSYAWRLAALDPINHKKITVTAQDLAKKEEITRFFEMLENELDARNFYSTPGIKPRMVLNMRNMKLLFQISVVILQFQMI